MSNAKLPTVKKGAKPKKRACGKPSMLDTNELTSTAGENSKYIAVNMALLNMGDIDLYNAEQVLQRLTDFFMLYAMNDMKPTLSGMALALNNMRRQQLWAIANDRPTGGAGYKAALPQEVADIIKKAHMIMENLWEIYMQTGRINPVVGIFLGKNHYGYQDKTEHVLTPNTQRDSDYDPEDIKQRYLLGKSIPTLEEQKD